MQYALNQEYMHDIRYHAVNASCRLAWDTTRDTRHPTPDTRYTCSLVTLAMVAYYLHTLHVHTMYTCFTCALLACAILPHYLHTPYVHTMYTCFTCALSTPTLLAHYLHALC